MNLDRFWKNPFPVGAPVVPTHLLGDKWEADAVKQYFVGKSLGDVTLESLLREYPYDKQSFYHLLSDQAFVFFLPALLKIGLDDYDDEWGALLGGSLVESLNRMARGDMDHRLLPLLNSYNRQQLNFVAEFLEEMSDRYFFQLGDDDEAANALKLLWKNYRIGDSSE